MLFLYLFKIAKTTNNIDVSNSKNIFFVPFLYPFLNLKKLSMILPAIIEKNDSKYHLTIRHNEKGIDIAYFSFIDEDDCLTEIELLEYINENKESLFDFDY